ncbi:MAG: MFS transporter [Opitutus sp.]
MTQPETVQKNSLPGTNQSGEHAPTKISWLRIGLLNFVWFGEVYSALLLSVGLTFVARQFTSDPRLIALASTIGLLFKGTIGPAVNYVTDRVSTRWGRRRPFVVVAYTLSAAGLCIIPLSGSITVLMVAVAGYACVLAFASPMESLYMQLIPAAQQGRSQAVRTAFIDACVLFFFQISLFQFPETFPNFPRWAAPAGGVTGVHLAFWAGAGFFLLSAVYLATHGREPALLHEPGSRSRRPKLGQMLRSFPRDVFADWRWWPVYGIYLAPTVAAGVWGSLRSLMLVEQFGYNMAQMARIGLPVSLTGIIVFAPLMGYGADRGDRLPRWLLVLVSLLMVTASWLSLPKILPSGDLPPLRTSLAFCLPLGLASVCLLLASINTLQKHARTFCRRTCFIIVSFSAEAAMALLAWACTHFDRSSPEVLPVSTWLGFLTLAKTFGLAASVATMPLVFSKIPPAKFGTVSSGFGMLSAFLTYALANLGGYWVHAWTRWQGESVSQYSSLWLLETLGTVAALVLVLRCARVPVDGVTKP